MTYLEDLNAHYKAVRARLNAGPPKPVVVYIPPPPEPVVEEEEKKVVWIDPLHGITAPDEVKKELRSILDRHKMDWKQIIQRNRELPYLKARVDVYLMLRNRGWSYPKIGKFCGGRDHTTILHSIGRHADNYCHKVKEIEQ